MLVVSWNVAFWSGALAERQSDTRKCISLMWSKAHVGHASLSGAVQARALVTISKSSCGRLVAPSAPRCRASCTCLGSREPA